MVELDRKRREHFVKELLKAEENKQSHFNVLSQERYSELLEEVRQAEMATKKSPLQYRRLSRFHILQVDGVDRLISRTAKNGVRHYLSVEEAYEVLRKVHESGGGHSGRDKMFSQVAKMYANVTKEMVIVYLASCEVCQGRQNKKQEGGSPPLKREEEGGLPLKLEETETIKNEMQIAYESPTSFNEFDQEDTKPIKLEESPTIKDELLITEESPTSYNEFDEEETKPIKLEEPATVKVK